MDSCKQTNNILESSPLIQIDQWTAGHIFQRTFEVSSSHISVSKRPHVCRHWTSASFGPSGLCLCKTPEKMQLESVNLGLCFYHLQRFMSSMDLSNEAERAWPSVAQRPRQRSHMAREAKHATEPSINSNHATEACFFEIRKGETSIKFGPKLGKHVPKMNQFWKQQMSTIVLPLQWLLWLNKLCHKFGGRQLGRLKISSRQDVQVCEVSSDLKRRHKLIHPTRMFIEHAGNYWSIAIWTCLFTMLKYIKKSHEKNYSGMAISCVFVKFWWLDFKWLKQGGCKWICWTYACYCHPASSNLEICLTQNLPHMFPRNTGHVCTNLITPQKKKMLVARLPLSTVSDWLSHKFWNIWSDEDLKGPKPLGRRLQLYPTAIFRCGEPCSSRLLRSCTLRVSGLVWNRIQWNPTSKNDQLWKIHQLGSLSVGYTQTNMYTSNRWHAVVCHVRFNGPHLLGRSLSWRRSQLLLPDYVMLKGQNQKSTSKYG